MSQSEAPAIPSGVSIRLDGQVAAPGTVPPISERFPSPEIVIDGISGFGLNASNLKVTFFSERPEITGAGPERIVVCRLVMSTFTAQHVAVTLRSVLDDLVSKGLIPPLPLVKVE